MPDNSIPAGIIRLTRERDQLRARNIALTQQINNAPHTKPCEAYWPKGPCTCWKKSAVRALLPLEVELQHDTDQQATVPKTITLTVVNPNLSGAQKPNLFRKAVGYVLAAHWPDVEVTIRPAMLVGTPIDTALSDEEWVWL